MLMLSLDQIQRELKAILAFDLLFLANRNHYPEEILGFELRKLREKELLGFAQILASNIGSDTDEITVFNG